MKYHIERSTLIDADKDRVLSFIKDFNKWNSWSPWTIIEPDCSITVEGTPGDEGHMMRWDGSVIGSGINTLVSNNGSELTYNLEFWKPWKSKAQTRFILEETNEGTKVTWTMDSSMPFFLFFALNSMKTLISLDYDRGLRMLKEMSEKGTVDADTTVNGIVDLEGFSYVGIQKTAPIEQMGPEMKKDFEKLMHDVIQKRGKSAKNWLSLYPKMDMKNMRMTYIAAVSDEALQGEDLSPEYVRGTVKTGKAFEIKHRGSYDFIGNGWSMGMMHIRAQKLKQGGVPFELYWNNPKEVSPHELQTSIYFPLK